MHEENINQDKQQSKIHSKLQEFKFAARSWLDDTIQELKTNPSHAVWKISSATVFFCRSNILSLCTLQFN